MKQKRHKRVRVGHIGGKILLLLLGGITLSLTRRPDHYFRVVNAIKKEGGDLSERSIRDAIQNLYRSKLISCNEHDDGTVTLTLTSEGGQKALRFNLDTITIQKPQRWDKIWRIVAFGIPEEHRKGRDALARKLRTLDFVLFRKVFSCTLMSVRTK